MRTRTVLALVTWILVALATCGTVTGCLVFAQERTVVTADGKGRITTHSPRLSPAEAAAVLTRGVPPAGTVPPARPATEAWLPPSTYRPGDGPFGPFPASQFVGRPLNCCGTYSTPLPYPTIHIVKD